MLSRTNEDAAVLDLTPLLLVALSMAGVGLAALVTGILTGQGWKKAATTGLIATLIAFAKKLWWLVLLPFLWLGKKLFHRGEGAQG